MDTNLKDKTRTNASPMILSAVASASNVHIAFFLSLLLALVDQSSSSDNQTELISTPNHLTWKQNNTRFDFVFKTSGNIENILKLETDSNNFLTSSLTNCNGHSACLFQDGKLVDYFQSVQSAQDPSKRRNKSDYVSTRPALKSNQLQTVCDRNQFTILHYCSTHWNPPAYLYKNRCSHTIEWHSPLVCHANSTNYERPCYLYDTQGNLIDLTPWIRSDGSSYKVNTTLVNASKNDTKDQLKGFYINVCNEAYDMCGPHIAACYMSQRQNGLVEAGYNNLTSIKFDAKENNTISVTYQGHVQEQCEDSRVKTVVRFVCKKRGIISVDGQVGPKLIRSDSCTNVIEWTTVHACPLGETKQDLLPGCKLSYAPLGIDIDVRQMTGNRTLIEVPNIDSSNKKMILGICEPVPRSLRCEGRETRSTSACLVDANDKSSQKTANNSLVVGNMLRSTLKLADDRLYLESRAANKTCSTLVNDNRGSFNVTRQIGVRIEFICSSKEQNSPNYLGFSDCTYVFEWGSPVMCLEPLLIEKNSSSIKQVTKMGNIVPDLSDSETRSPRPPTSDDVARKTAAEQHKETLDDATRINDSVVHHDEHHHQEAPIVPSIASKSTSKLNEESKRVPANQMKIGPPKMDTIHKSFMICLIVMSLVAFLILILVLDKRTRLRISIETIRRQARQTFHTQPVPYTRVVDDLDL